MCQQPRKRNAVVPPTPAASKPKSAKSDSKAKGKQKAKGKSGEGSSAKPDSSPPESSDIRLIVRLDFSDHEKLSYTRWMERIPASQPDPEMVHAERETLQVINEMLGKMKPALRRVFTMTYYDELSTQEASALLGVPVGTFKARLFRARRQLRNQAQRALVAPIRRANPSSFFPDGSAVKRLVARPLDTSSLEASYS